jgi:hypothetical protein
MRIWRTWRTFLLLVGPFVRQKIYEFVLAGFTGTTGFLLFSARRQGIIDALVTTLPTWMLVTVSGSMVLKGIGRMRELAQMGELCNFWILFTLNMATGGYIGAHSSSFPRGCKMLLACYSIVGTMSFVLPPFYEAVILTGLREGDAVVLNNDAAWTVLMPMGDGFGMMATDALLPDLLHVIQEHRMFLTNYDIVWTRPCDIDRNELIAVSFRLQRHVRIIQRAWRRAMSDPGYSMCRARLLREAGELGALQKVHKDWKA